MGSRHRGGWWTSPAPSWKSQKKQTWDECKLCRDWWWYKTCGKVCPYCPSRLAREATVAVAQAPSPEPELPPGLATPNATSAPPAGTPKPDAALNAATVRAIMALLAGNPALAPLHVQFAGLAEQFKPEDAAPTPKECGIKWKESLAKVSAAHLRTQKAEREGAKLATELAELESRRSTLIDKCKANKAEITAARQEHDKTLAAHRDLKLQGAAPAAGSQGPAGAATPTAAPPAPATKPSHGLDSEDWDDEMEADEQAEGAAGVEPEEGDRTTAEARAEAKERQRLMRHVAAAYGIFKRRKLAEEPQDFDAYIRANFVPGDLKPPDADSAQQAQQKAEEAVRMAAEVAEQETGQAEKPR